MDAGAKIYAGRVDAIYNDVYKMLGGFGCANKQDKGKGVFCHVTFTQQIQYRNILYFCNVVIDSGDEETEGESLKTKHVRGKKVRRIYAQCFYMHNINSLQRHTNGFSSQIVKDVSAINTDNYDLEFEVGNLTTTLCKRILILQVDPLFKKMSAAFDEGGAAGLLINQLRLDSDHCQLMMDGNSKIFADVAPIPSVPINVSSLRS